MKKMFRLISFIVCILMVLSLIACGSNNGKDSSGTSNTNVESTAAASNEATTQETEANSKNLELSVAIWGIQDGFSAAGAQNDTIYNNLAKNLNVTIKPVQVTWDDFNDKIKIWAASNQLPDIFAVNLATDNYGLYQTWSTQGILKALPDDLSEYPNISKVMSLPAVKPLAINGKFYMYPRMTYSDSSNWALDRDIIYRKDWAAQAGFTSDPKDFDEFVAMCKAVMKAHPGVSGVAANAVNYLINDVMLASCPEWANVKSWVNEDGKWIPGFASKGFMNGLVQLRTLWTSGVLDRDFATQKNGDGANKFLSGKAFVLCQSTLSDLNKFIQLNPSVNAPDALGIMKIWPAADGKRYSFVETPYWSETFFNSNISDEKLGRALKLVDYMSTEKYIAQVVNGIEGVDYKVENGKSISLLPSDQQLNTKYPITAAVGILGAWPGEFSNYSGKKVVNSNPAMAWGDQYIIDTFKDFKATETPAPINFDIMLMHTPAKDKIASLQAQILTVDIPKVILGKDDPQKMWQDTLKGYDAKGLQDAITEVNAEAAKLGIK